MLTIRCTKKLLERLKLSTTSSQAPPTSTTTLGDWYATYVPWRPKHLVLFVSEKARIAVLLHAAPLQTLAPRFLEAARQRLEALHLSPEATECELAKMQPIAFAPTGGQARSRSTMASMTQFLQVLAYQQERQEMPDEMALYLGGFGVGVGKEYFRPDESARELLDPETTAAQARILYQLKATIQGSDPAIWRQLLIPACYTLHQLHNVLQGAFGWKRSHLHRFEVAGASFAPRYQLDFEDEIASRSDRSARLLEVLPAIGSRLLYEYDFGDSWCHEVVLEEIVGPPEEGPSCRCLAGERSGPPEDCGGIHAYQEVLAALAGKPSSIDSEELADWREWAGPDFDPARFEIEKCRLYAHW